MITESVVMRWVKLEPAIQSESSQKEKNKYHIKAICLLTDGQTAALEMPFLFLASVLWA